jgi:transposase
MHNPTRESVGYYGAVRLRDGKFYYLREEETFTGDSFFTFLKQLRRISSHAKRRVVLIIDNVRYHHAALHKTWRQACSPQFALEFMPPYSPELNPIERLWKLTRRKATHNQYFSRLPFLMLAVERLFLRWAKPNDTLRRLCAII